MWISRSTVCAALVSALAVAPVARAQPFVYVYDDGTGSVNIGPTFAAEFLWGNTYDVQPGQEWITTVQVAFGSVDNGTPVKLYVFEDPTPDNNPGDSVLVAQTTGLSDQSRTNIFISYAIRPAVRVRPGRQVFVAASCAVNGTTIRPARLDPQSFANAARARVYGATAIDPGNLGGSPFTLVMSSNAVQGTFMVRALAISGPCNPADIGDNASTPGFDGCVDNGDFSLFIGQFFNAQAQAGCTGATIPCSAADIANNSADATPDGLLDNGDFSLFISSFFAATCTQCS
jgi:hypothetical protein